MLSNCPTGSYQQDKADTDAVPTWLVRTAKRCGYSADLLDQAEANVQAAKKSGRLKGKARKEAKAAAAAIPSTSSATPAANSKRHTIGVHDFIDLAHLIASHSKPPIQVPNSFTAILNRTIFARKRHS